MRQIQTTIYKFDELSREAKDKAKQDYAASEGYIWADEALKSLEALAEHFDGKLTDYSIDYFATFHSSATFDMPEMEEAEIRSRLLKLGSFNDETLMGKGDCVLTGYCQDESAIDGFRKAYYKENERDLEKLMQAAFKTWLKDAQEDNAAFYEDDSFADHCEANNYEFHEDGSVA